MSDNVTLPGVSAVIATDDVAGVQYQRVKLDFGDDGASVPVTAAVGLPVAGIRKDADVADGADLAAHRLLFNAFGRLKVSASPADLAVTTGNIIANGGQVAIAVSRISNLSITMTATSLVGHNAAFEYSNNSTNGVDGTWYSVQAVRSNAQTVDIATGVLAGTPAYGWSLNVSEYQWFRVRATTHTSGTAAYIFSPSAYASEPIPAVQVTATQPVSGTVTATVTGGTVLPVTPTTTFTNSAAATNPVSIKTSAGTVWSIYATNTNAAVRYLKLYNKASAPTVGTDVPVLTAALSPGAPTLVQGGANGLRFTTGIALALTTGATDGDTTAVAAAEIKLATSFT